MSLISAIELIDAFLGDFFVLGRASFVAGGFVDGGVEFAAEGFAGAVDFADAFADCVAESACHVGNVVK
jgi:hypothetical protein